MYVIVVLGVLVTIVSLAGAVPLDMFYAFGSQNGDKALKKGFRERSDRIRLEGGFNFLGSRFYNVWVLTDGYLAVDHLTDRFASEIKPFPSSGDGAIIAPYLADVDTSGVGSIYYRHIADPDDPTVMAISKDINDSNFKDLIGRGFHANMAIIATWHEVGYFHNHADKNNTFQVAVASDDIHTVAVFNYLDDGLNWYQADSDYYYDDADDEPEASPVQVGFNKGGDGGISFTLQRFTLTPNVTNLDKYSNRGKFGQWTFIVGDENVKEPSRPVGGTGTVDAAPVLDTPSSSTVTVVVGSPLTLSCTSRGSNPDTFTWRKDSDPTILQSTSITTVTQNSTSAVVRADYSIDSVTTSDSGTYTCTVTNPMGSDSETITVTVFDVVCGSSIKKCRRNRRCSRILERFRTRCSILLQPGSPCATACMQSVNRLIGNQLGRNVWFCRNHHGLVNRLRRFYIRRCQTT